MNKEEQGSLQKRIYLKDYLEKSSVLSSSYLHKNASGLATPKLLACSQTDVFNKLHSEQNLGFPLGEVDQGHDSANLIHSWRTCQMQSFEPGFRVVVIANVRQVFGGESCSANESIHLNLADRCLIQM
jgi:hypothetical protein